MMLRSLSRTFLLLACGGIAFGVSSSSAQPVPPAQTQAAPRPGTAEAFQCLLRQGPKGCSRMFVGSANRAAQPWVWENLRRDFENGELESSGYWGQASPSNIFDSAIMIHQPATEMDIYDAKFAHHEYTFYIAPADADGKIHALAVRFYAPHSLDQLPSAM